MGNIKCSPKEERATSSNRGTCCRPCRELARQVRVKWRTTPEDHTVGEPEMQPPEEAKESPGRSCCPLQS
ncbi:hypothetical protein ACKLNR_009937 [Fusarium oxysporum f. sp. zingiberi]